MLFLLSHQLDDLLRPVAVVQDWVEVKVGEMSCVSSSVCGASNGMFDCVDTLN